MSSTEALKDFYKTWFNSPKKKADIEAIKLLGGRVAALPLLSALTPNPKLATTFIIQQVTVL